MSDTSSSERATYDEARSAFERLKTQDKVAFVVEATLTTLGKAAAAAATSLATVFDDLAAERQAAADDPPRPDPPEAGPDAPDVEQP